MSVALKTAKIIPDIADPVSPTAHERATRSIKITLDVLLGRSRHDELYTLVTWSGLIEAGLISEADARAAIKRLTSGS